MSKQPLIVLVGQTASGKSSLAIELARHYDAELVCADAWTVYRGFDVGTAKPSHDEQKGVQHHLLDVAKPEDGFSAAVFKRLADAAIEQIHAKHKLPILVGGTGLYIDSVLYDYSFMAPSSEEVRKELDSLTIQELLQKISEKHIHLDGIDTRNKRRLVRLLESDGRRPQKHPLRQNTLVLGIDQNPETLKERINQRVDTMFEHGLEDEVRELVQQYGWDIEPMKGIGYREFRPYFDGSCGLTEVKEAIIRSTLQLAKKQKTWFKRNPDIHWISDQEQAAKLITEFLNKKM